MVWRCYTAHHSRSLILTSAEVKTPWRGFPVSFSIWLPSSSDLLFSFEFTHFYPVCILSFIGCSPWFFLSSLNILHFFFIKPIAVRLRRLSPLYNLGEILHYFALSSLVNFAVYLCIIVGLLSLQPHSSLSVLAWVQYEPFDSKSFTFHHGCWSLVLPVLKPSFSLEIGILVQNSGTN